MKVLLLVIVVLLLFSKIFRFIITHTPQITYYGIKDTIKNIIFSKGAVYNEFGIDMYIGNFGRGKTLSMVRRAYQLKKVFKDNLVIISNIHLKNIEYIPLINFQQLIDLEETDETKGYLVLIDEVSSVLSHRNYANFPIELIGLLCQQRKRHIKILCTSQKFFMVDKIFRAITNRVIDCNKTWRIAKNTIYDSWEYENATNKRDLHRINNKYWFVYDRFYNMYDTSEMVTKAKSEDFISNETAIVRKGLNEMKNNVKINGKKLKVN